MGRAREGHSELPVSGGSLSAPCFLSLALSLPETSDLRRGPTTTARRSGTRSRGEDIDFGLRPRGPGQVGWCPEDAVTHQFEDCLDDFDRRFLRYGRGMRTLADKWGQDLAPFEFQAMSPDLQWLADRQFVRMLEGYQGDS